MELSPPLDQCEHQRTSASTGYKHDEIRSEEGLREWVTIRGVRVSLQITGYRQPQDNYVPRATIKTFSKRARRRMLCKIAEIDWHAAGSVLFVTVTYPPAFENHTPKERSQHRAQFNRSVERHLGGPVGSLWRVEWKVRQSGETVGQVAPHIHNLYFGCRFMSKRWVSLAWGRAIGCNTPVVVDVQRCDDRKKIQVYIAKYCSKECDLLLLDNVPYRNKCGRHAGWLRKSEIPMFPLRVFRVRSRRVLDFLATRAAENLPNYDARYPGGFTFLGDVAEELSQDLAKFILDGDLETC